MRRPALSVVFIVCLLALSTPAPLSAQLAAPGEAGVVMGHVHFVVRDLEANRRLWTTLGGTPVENGRLQLIQFPGTFVMVRQAEHKGGSAGSVVNHVGFMVKDLKGSLDNWEAAGLKIERAPSGRNVYVITPDEVRVEILEDATMTMPIRMHHVHLFVPSPLETQAWYAKTFGAVPGKRGNDNAADLPGVNLTFRQGEGSTVGTQGRSLDHIGFEVKNLEQFCKKLEAAGMKLDRPYTRLADSQTAIAFLTDPWGTYIELTENLAPAAK